MDLILEKGIVIVEGIEVQRSVAIKHGKIEGIYSLGSEPEAKESVDCEGHYILPGVIDAHVHLRDLGQAEKEDFASGTMAAAAGGITTVVDMAPTAKPNSALSSRLTRR
ncbi:MAG: amidohydrolase family protein [Candidatus Thorarchaeota archaeon]